MIESMNSVVRQVCRNVKRWRNARMALRWTGAAMLEAQKGFQRLKAQRHLSQLKAALETHRIEPGHDTRHPLSNQDPLSNQGCLIFDCKRHPC